MNRSSMLYWWPRIKDLPILQPKTIIVLVPTNAMATALDGDLAQIDPFIPKFHAAAEELGYPLFVRTDILSAKHHYEHTCYVPAPDELLPHIASLIEMNFMIFGPGPSAIVFREYVLLAACFTAFEGLPIAPERRYFVRDGRVECHHPYWPAEAIRDPDTESWPKLLAAMNKEGGWECVLLEKLALQVARCLPGYWSIDFALAKDGRWYLIDCAEGDKSWHPECEYNKEINANP